jgi:hypothetical protein
MALPVYLSYETVNGEARMDHHPLLKRTDAEKSAGVTPVNYAYAPGPEAQPERYGADPTGVVDSTDAIQAAINVLWHAGGGTVVFGYGTYRYTALTLKTFVHLRGAGKYATTLDCRLANGVVSNTVNGITVDNVSIDARGSATGGFPLDRKIISIRDLTIDGTNAGNLVQCLALGWNMRSMPLLYSVRIAQFAHYAISFNDWNWNISFCDVEIDTCGKTTTNSAGIYKDPAVDASTFNYIIFDRVQVESCGTASSTAGGWNMQTTTANRSMYFLNCIAENNLGTDQILVTNCADVQFINLYMEVADDPSCITALELSNVLGTIQGGFLSGLNSANNDFGVQLKGGSDVSITGMTTQAFGVAHYDFQTCKARVCKLLNSPTYQVTANSQLSGDLGPCWDVTMSGNQTGIVNNTFTKVALDTENRDTGRCFSTSNNRLTPRTTGQYRSTVAVRWDTNVTAFDQYLLCLYRNGALYKEHLVRPAELASFEHKAQLDFYNDAVGTYWEIFVRHVDGGAPANRTLNQSTATTWWTGSLDQADM